ncbi:MAG: DUF4340 domain-containing protein [Oscillospiraceae bacterium]|nr:DUF4340 domain-containing protein [Oscillospiraceae bacterium]
MQNEQKKKGLADNTKLLIILGAVLLVMGAAFFIMKFVAEDDTKSDSADTTEAGETVKGENGETPSIGGETTPGGETTTQSDSATSTSSKIIDRSSSDVTSVEILDDTGEHFTITYEMGEEGQTSTMSDADSLLKYSVDEMNTLSGYVSLLVALEEVGESDDDALFGFDNPRRRMTITFKNGDKVTLLIGKDTPFKVGSESGVYIRREDSNVVYTVGGSTSEILMQKKSDYREILLFSMPSDYKEFVEITISRNGQPDLKVVKRDADEKEIAEDPSLESYIPDYKIVSPIERSTDNYAVEEKLFNKILTLKSAEIVEDYPKDLKMYGLDNPVKLHFVTASGIEKKILIGNKTKSGGRYVMEEGIPTVGEASVDINLTTISYADIAERLIWFFDSTSSPVFEYELPNGEKHTLSVWSENRSVKTKYDGNELPGSNGKNLFFYTVGMTLSGECKEGTPLGECAIKIKATFDTGEVSTLELLKLNERQYAARIDGEAPKFYVGVDEVKALLDCFDIIKNGGTIPDAL